MAGKQRTESLVDEGPRQPWVIFGFADSAA